LGLSTTINQLLTANNFLVFPFSVVVVIVIVIVIVIVVVILIEEFDNNNNMVYKIFQTKTPKFKKW
jgi:hypothetical protein